MTVARLELTAAHKRERATNGESNVGAHGPRRRAELLRLAMLSCSAVVVVLGAPGVPDQAGLCVVKPSAQSPVAPGLGCAPGLHGVGADPAAPALSAQVHYNHAPPLPPPLPPQPSPSAQSAPAVPACSHSCRLTGRFYLRVAVLRLRLCSDTMYSRLIDSPRRLTPVTFFHLCALSCPCPSTSL